MKPWRSRAAVAALSAAAIAGGFYGGSALLEKYQFAQAEAQVESSRADLDNAEDLATIFRQVGKVVGPSVVNIQVSKEVKNDQDDMIRKFFQDHGEDVPPGFGDDDGGSEQEVGTGSGVIMEAENGYGYILTNNHVAGGADEMVITLADGRVIKNGKLLGADPKSDLAVVRIKADDLIPAKWGNSDDMEKGDWVLAFGSPFGFIGSMTHGIVSALNRDDVGIIPQGYENFIQVDAPINPGNSGGPLVNLHGEVIGINTAIASRSGGFQGIGFAIPSNQAHAVYTALKEHGAVVRGYLGVAIADVSVDRGVARSFGYEKPTGVIVEDTAPDSPAAGILKQKDIIESYEGHEMDSTQQLRYEVANTPPGTEAPLTVFRHGKDVNVTVKIGEQPADLVTAMERRGSENQGGQEENSISGPVLGMTLETLTDDLGQKLSLPSGSTGAVVKDVKPDSVAAQMGIEPGVVITAVGDTPVSTADDAYKALKQVDPAKGVTLSLLTPEGNTFLFLQQGNGEGQ
ncbi:MAG TPA: trypsin-like peptidase domain-containing protein [Tepidisphaeraceae bacterium]|nr:trypsin-like peptidase domain-containing protein [Tepidisphaeraceae bacterium]